MNAQRAAEIQAALEGITLPATRPELVAYARANAPELVPDLETLPQMVFDRLDAVGDLLRPMLSAPREAPRLPRAESGEPPGRADYLKPFPADTGRVLHDAPRDNPPQQAIESASETQGKQKAAQGG